MHSEIQNVSLGRSFQKPERHPGSSAIPHKPVCVTWHRRRTAVPRKSTLSSLGTACCYTWSHIHRKISSSHQSHRHNPSMCQCLRTSHFLPTKVLKEASLNNNLQLIIQQKYNRIYYCSAFQIRVQL